MNRTWIIHDFEQALEQLKAALADPAETDLVKAGCIQYFEFSFELAWKSIRLAAADSGLEECGSPKACLKQAFALGWVDDETVWLEMLEARNRMSHTYNAKNALQIYEKLHDFYPRFESLLATLKGLF